ncbi:hypothetical protein N7519_006050 [Penicillium mononematosum]|uniref:uncharacterized protein n=1 Tax=Penicillium mononematosum TaxID=268346 RepID=UPI002547BEE1|nr:uncharacterized protein N7519_006050 [Penicillium mononematosum]KAJ6184749.1 hypothetical protein N7519_006050 [Penicillium mononematosum]
MSGGDEQGFDVRYRDPPFGRQSSAPAFGQSANGHTTTSLDDSPTVSFSPSGTIIDHVFSATVGLHSTP